MTIYKPPKTEPKIKRFNNGIRLPWDEDLDKPHYESRENVRKLLSIQFYFDVCANHPYCDPLELHEFCRRLKVWAAVDNLPEDKQGLKLAYKLACRAIEDHYQIERGTVT